MPTLIITVDLQCSRCRTNIQKLFLLFLTRYVVVSGPFDDAENLCCKLWCKAGSKIIKDIKIKPPPPPPETEEKKKPEPCKPEKIKIIPYRPCPYMYPPQYCPSPTRPCGCATSHCECHSKPPAAKKTVHCVCECETYVAVEPLLLARLPAVPAAGHAVPIDDAPPRGDRSTRTTAAAPSRSCMRQVVRRHHRLYSDSVALLYPGASSVWNLGVKIKMLALCFCR
uniref:HMA domain-containing protein n=1 Tax=Oryza punctata TaxID=4537 RepID=A0A0E0KQ23_ORYPU